MGASHCIKMVMVYDIVLPTLILPGPAGRVPPPQLSSGFFLLPPHRPSKQTIGSRSCRRCLGFGKKKNNEQMPMIWVNYNIWQTWIKAIWGWFPLLTMIPVRSQWHRYNLPRMMGLWWNLNGIIVGLLGLWSNEVPNMRTTRGISSGFSEPTDFKVVLLDLSWDKYGQLILARQCDGKFWGFGGATCSNKPCTKPSPKHHTKPIHSGWLMVVNGD